MLREDIQSLARQHSPDITNSQRLVRRAFTMRGSKTVSVNSERDDGHRLLEALRAHHLAGRFTAGIGGINPSEGAPLKPAKRRRILPENVLRSLQDDGCPGRKPVAKCQHLRTANTERLALKID